MSSSFVVGLKAYCRLWASRDGHVGEHSLSWFHCDKCALDDVRDATSDFVIHLPTAALSTHSLVVLLSDQTLGTQQFKYWTPVPSVHLNVFTVLWNKNK